MGRGAETSTYRIFLFDFIGYHEAFCSVMVRHGQTSARLFLNAMLVASLAELLVGAVTNVDARFATAVTLR